MWYVLQGHRRDWNPPCKHLFQRTHQRPAGLERLMVHGWLGGSRPRGCWKSPRMQWEVRGRPLKRVLMTNRSDVRSVLNSFFSFKCSVVGGILFSFIWFFFMFYFFYCWLLFVVLCCWRMKGNMFYWSNYWSKLWLNSVRRLTSCAGLMKFCWPLNVMTLTTYVCVTATICMIMSDWCAQITVVWLFIHLSLFLNQCVSLLCYLLLMLKTNQ